MPGSTIGKEREYESEGSVIISLRTWMAGCTFALIVGASSGLAGQTPVTPESTPATAGQPSKDSSGKQQLGVQTPGQKNGGTQTPQAGTDAASGKAGDQGGASKSAHGSDSEIKATAPSVRPPGPLGRRRIGVALGGGGALGLSEIGALQWFEEHHIPVDVIAGTSMGGMISALYATGNSIDQLKAVMNDRVFGSVFRISTTYASRSFRRREDSRDLPNGLTIGLKHGVSFRNSVLIDQGLNSFLDREFLRYDDQVDFNTLPIPFRCLSTDLNEARTVTFARGSIPDAVRASISIPGIYRPFEMNGHEYVDGAVLANLPSQTVRDDLGADVVIAVSLPLVPVGKNDLDSILGVLQRSFSVAIEGNERASRRLADVVVEPDLTGFSAGDYLKSAELAERGYAAAEKMKDALMPYAVDDAAWNDYIARRTARKRGPAGTLLRVRVDAPNESVTKNVERIFAPLVDQPVATDKVESLLADIRSDGRYDADYTVGYDKGPDRRPVLLVTVQDKKTGPPFLELGANVAAQTGGVSRATIEGIFVNQDLGGYGSELRSHIKLGYLTDFDSEYFRKVPNFLQIRPSSPVGTMFVAPHGGILRQPFPIYQGKTRVSERELQKAGGGVDIGWSDGRTTEIRAGWEENDIRWHEQIGVQDGLPNVYGSMQRARVRYALDRQDKAFVPQFGYRVTAEAGYLYNASGGANAPLFDMQTTLGHKFGNEIVAFGSEAGTMFGRNVAQPYRFTLGGPLRLSASAIDELRGTDYFLVRPAVLRKVANLPAVLGQSIYIGAVYEAGQMRAPDIRTATRQDVFLGVLAETPAGLISFGPALGDGGRYKLVFTLGKLF